jgi:hypothetical protein
VPQKCDEDLEYNGKCMETFTGKTFGSSCMSIGTGYVMAQNAYSKGSVIFKRMMYGDALCATLLYTNNDTFESTQVGIIANTEGATGFDLKLSAQVITPMSQTVVDTWNQSAACGIQHWQVGVAVPIGDGTSCSDSKVFLILNKIEADVLYPGDYPNGVNPAVRPTAVTKNPLLVQKRVNAH